MPRPLRFHSGPGVVLGGVFAFALGFALAYGLLFSLALSPLQQLYLSSYMALPVSGHTTKMFPVWWIRKTGPMRAPELATEADVVPARAARLGALPLALSPEAHAAGWTGLVRVKQMGRAREEAATLRDEFYGGMSFNRLMVTPLCGGMVFLLLYVAMRPKSGVQSRHEERHGRRTKGPELMSASGWAWGGKADGIRLRTAGRFGLPGPSFRIPRKLEASHILLMGDTGAGKSNAIRQILRQVEQRGESAIVYDPAGEFAQEFYRPERGDYLLNPLDARCPFWNLDAELSGRGVEDAIAAAMLPEKPHENAFFTDAPRRVLAALLRRGASVGSLLKWMAHPAEIEQRLAGTPHAAYLDRKAGPQRAGILSSLNLIADSLDLLPETAEGRAWFTTEKWKWERTRWVFLTSQPALRERILPLHAAWLDLLILRMMEPCANPAKPVWFVLDELASLNRLPQLHTAVPENRKYGNPVVLGFQGRSQIEKRYGQDAEAMLSQPATKIFFKTSEPRAAKWISETLGEIEVERLKESRSPGPLRSKRNYAMEITTKPLVMASEIAGLAPLTGYVKQENRVVPVKFAYVPKRSLQPQFLERRMTVPESRVVQSLIAEPVSEQVRVQLSKPVQPPSAQVSKEIIHQQNAMAMVPISKEEPAISLFAEPAPEKPTQPEPRKSAFKKKEGAVREWRPVD